MILRYRNGIEDYVAFSRYFYEHGPANKRQMRFIAAFVFVIGLMATLFAYMLVARFVEDRIGESLPRWLKAAILLLGLVTGVAGGIAACYVTKPITIYLVERNVRQLYRQNPDPLAYVEQELELQGDWLICRTPLSESRVKLELVEDFVETQLHVFIRLSAMRAYILPRQSFAQDELETFLEELANARAQPAPLAIPREPTDAIQAQPRG